MATKYRGFSCITYLNPPQVEEVLRLHDNNLKAYAYILHDKDINEDGTIKEPHIHLLIYLNHPTTVSAVRRWLGNWRDINGEIINTLAQPMHDIGACFDYLTHNTEQCRLEGKTPYSIGDITTNDWDFFSNSEIEPEDNLTRAFNDLLDGMQLTDVVRKYGRDFIIHYSSIKLLLDDISYDEKSCNAKGVERQL